MCSIAHHAFNMWEDRHSSQLFFAHVRSVMLQLKAQKTVIFCTSSFPAVRTQLPFHNTSKLR